LKTEDKTRFKDSLNGAWLATTNGKETPHRAVMDIFWSTFQNVSIEDFEAAVMTHLRTPKSGEFPPKLASLCAALSGQKQNDGRPEADEAWGIAIQASGEDATIVWTPEIRSAWAAAEPIIIEARDRIGARRAFIAAYERLVDQVRQQNEPVKWEVSLGTDPHAREQALFLSANLNRISSSSANAMIEMVRPLALPSPETGGMEVLAHIRKVRESLAMDRKKRDDEMQAARDAAAAKVGPSTANLVSAGDFIRAKSSA
jgi:hypothetical protein